MVCDEFFILEQQDEEGAEDESADMSPECRAAAMCADRAGCADLTWHPGSRLRNSEAVRDLECLQVQHKGDITDEQASGFSDQVVVG
jgi:hypothetical protein